MDNKMTIAGQNMPCACVLAGENPIERHAAEEFVKYVGLITGVRLEISEHIPAKTVAAVKIGEKAGLSKEVLANLSHDGYVIHASDGELLLAGVEPVSSLYAVYAFLEEYAGCGFFEDGDQVPRADEIAVPDIERMSSPRFKDRVYHSNMQYAYNGMIWWDERQLIEWVDFLAKKRINIWEPTRILGGAGVLAYALERMGYDIQPTAYQKERCRVLKCVVAHARLAGIRVLGTAIQYNQGHEGNTNEPGTYPFCDRAQLEAFIRQYKAQSGDEIPVYHYEWGGSLLPVADPRHPEVRRLVRNIVNVFDEIFDTGHLYYLPMPSEGGFGGEYSVEETGQIVKSMINLLKDEILVADPQAEIIMSPPFAYGRTYSYQVEAIRENRLKVGFDFWLNMPGRFHGFLMEEYFYGNEWISGMVSHCGKHTNPWGDAMCALENAKRLAEDPKADNCTGFCVGNEINHRNIMINDLFLAIAWDPMQVGMTEFITRYSSRRYGSGSPELREVSQIIADTLLSSYNMDVSNMPLYRQMLGGYLPGLTAVSVKRTLGYLPELHRALCIMAEHADGQNPFFRFDAVDIGRTYLGALFNLYLAGARLGGSSGNLEMVELYTDKALETMRFIARFAGAHEQFRLTTHYNWARRWPPILPHLPESNERSVFIIFTNLISETIPTICDYMADDFSELVEQYYLPRIQAYLENLKKLVEKGSILSGRLCNEGSDQPMPNRMDDFAPPRGTLSWSAFGTMREPELTGDDRAIRERLVHGPNIVGQSPFYDGPIEPLLRELLVRYPLPDDTETLIALDPVANTYELEPDPIETIAVGEKVDGIVKGLIVEKVIMPEEVKYLFEIQKLSSEYNLLRGEIGRYLVRADDFMSFWRIEDGVSIDRINPVKLFAFECLRKKYILTFDPGSSGVSSSLSIANDCNQ